MGDITMPLNYFDISVKWCSLYACTVLCVLHILINLFLQNSVWHKVFFPSVQQRNLALEVNLFAPNHTVNDRDRIWIQALRICVFSILLSLAKNEMLSKNIEKKYKKREGDKSTNNKSTIKCLIEKNAIFILLIHIFYTLTRGLVH